jgi:predicted dehydrogenase
VDRPPDYGSYGESLAVREGDIVIPRISNIEPLRAELNHFAAVVRGEESPRSGVREGLEVVRILAAASESLLDGGRVIELGQTRVSAE